MVERIVIVDDEEGILALLRRVLRAPGREVEVFPTATSALESMRLHRPDVVVTDLNMPGMTGFDFIQRIREEFGATLGIIVVTAFATLVSDTDAVADGVGAYLRKPFTDLDLLRSTVTDVIDSARRVAVADTPDRVQRDLDARATALRHQRASLSRASAVVDQIADGILIADRAGRLMQLNPAAAELLQVRGEESLGRPLDELQIESELRSAVLAPTTRGPDGLAARRIPIAATGRVVEVTTTPLIDSAGNRAGLLSVLRDVTAEVRVQEVKHHYLTVVAHELRTPLTAIKSFASCLERERADASSSAPPVLFGIREQVLRLERQVDKLILLARLECGDVRIDPLPFDVAAATDDALQACRPLALERGVQIEVEAPPDLRALGDVDDFRRALIEMGDNALKFSPQDGLVSVTVEADEREVCVSVRDRGPGVAPDRRTSLFAPYRSLAIGSDISQTGLGLCLARRVIEASGGRIALESTGPEGSTFTLRLPRHESSARQSPRAESLLELPV